MKRYGKQAAVILAAGITMVIYFVPTVFSHCEIPCGIYDDAMRLNMMAEHIATIEKSMQQIEQLQKNSETNHNQLVRWIVNKENHADQLSEIAAQYFLKQRVVPLENNREPGYPKYIQQVTLLHQMMVYSMKCKQTTDLENVAKLRQCLDQFKTVYLGADVPSNPAAKP